MLQQEIVFLHIIKMEVRRPYISEYFVCPNQFILYSILLFMLMPSAPTICCAPVLPVVGLFAAMSAH